MWLCLKLCTEGVLNVAVFKISRRFGTFTSNLIHAKFSFPLKLTSSAVTLAQKADWFRYHTFHHDSKRCMMLGFS
jgi:hypothetical protein